MNFWFAFCPRFTVRWQPIAPLALAHLKLGSRFLDIAGPTQLKVAAAETYIPFCCRRRGGQRIRY